jgi:hypothetical protein
MTENAEHNSQEHEGGLNVERKAEEALSTSIESALERLLAPIAQAERLKRREYLTPEEVEVVYGLNAATLANKRSRAQGPEYIKDGDRILYKQQAVRNYLDARTVKTRM